MMSAGPGSGKSPQPSSVSQPLFTRGGGRGLPGVPSLSSLLLIAQSCPTLLRPTWTVAHQALLSVGFSRQEYWSGLPFPSPGDLPHPGIEPMPPTLQMGSLPTELEAQ